MSRSRASLAGGYTRKTVSLPTSVVEAIEEYLESAPGVTISAFLTDAANDHLKKMSKRKFRS